MSRCRDHDATVQPHKAARPSLQPQLDAQPPRALCPTGDHFLCPPPTRGRWHDYLPGAVPVGFIRQPGRDYSHVSNMSAIRRAVSSIYRDHPSLHKIIGLTTRSPIHDGPQAKAPRSEADARASGRHVYHDQGAMVFLKRLEHGQVQRMGDILVEVVRLGGPAAIADGGRAKGYRGTQTDEDAMETALKPLWTLEAEVLGGQIHDVGAACHQDKEKV
ncbi:uncharacterized protein F5Z01DRAFT_637794 [Emericellopsis atlantica]|uniref:Uncharacterized protein n=1 Tax=Emericellopsis atlantica TaxID=2614577 RepID=A0A9P7ZJU4_9HYPO|nr:uncharacterized protein F5Z01DRAFT_637794 [Emericellopsis atlantica]KAG9253041.1 hypothetical protein F5Z01DRAFT_637794 [Emericellopsis atlantica]